MNHIAVRPLSAVVAWFAILIRSLEAEIVVLQSGIDDGKDISLYERTDIPVSSSPSLFVINTGPPGPGFDDFVSLVEFDLSSLSVSAELLLSATFRLYENNQPTFSFLHVSPEFPNTIEVRPVATPWDEETVRFSTLPGSAPGHAVSRLVDGVEQWFSWDVTNVVREWLDGSLENNGFLVTSKMEVRDEGVVVAAAFDASEQQTPPILEIEIMNSELGDYDGNGVVDHADYTEWRNTFGTLTGTLGSGADGNGNGVVDAADYTVWRDNLAAPPSITTFPVSVPEPPSRWLYNMAAVAIVVVGARGRDRRMPVTGMIAAALLATLIGFAATSSAVTIPFREDFATDTTNWQDADTAIQDPFTDVSHVPTGGVGGAGDGYITLQRTFTANPDFAQTVFRAHDEFDASGDAFVGDWLTAGVNQFSFWVRHDADADLTFGTRFATSANSPGANGIGTPSSVPANVWTRVALPISTANINPEGPPSDFDTVFGSLGNLQISVRPGDQLNVPITFDLDRVAIVPEPASGAVLGAAALFVLLAGTHRSTVLRTTRLSLPLWTFLFAAAAAWADEGEQQFAYLLAPLPEPLASFGAASHDGWLYVYGGHVGETHDHSRENVRGNFRRQPLTGGDWEELPGGPALQSPALVANGDYLYHIGGLSAHNPPEEPSDLQSVAHVARFHSQTGVWEEIASLPEPRSSHDAVVLGNRIYVAGGWNHHGEEGDAEWHESTLMLELGGENRPLKWKSIAPAPFQRRALALATCAGRVYAIGGICPDGSFSRRVDVYDPQTNMWTRGADLPVSDLNGFGSSAFEIGGRLFTSSRDERLLVLSPDETRWMPVAELVEPRFFHRIVPGAKGAVLLVGGAGYDGHLDTIDVVRATDQGTETTFPDTLSSPRH